MHHILVSWCKIPTAHHRFTEARINPANASFALVRPHSINAHTATAQPAAGFILFDTSQPGNHSSRASSKSHCDAWSQKQRKSTLVVGTWKPLLGLYVLCFPVQLCIDTICNVLQPVQNIDLFCCLFVCFCSSGAIPLHN